MNHQKPKFLGQSSHTFSMLMVLIAYLLWSLLVVYLWFLKSVSPIEVVLHRAFWATLMLWSLSLLSGKFSKVIALFKFEKQLGYLLISTFFLTINWSMFVYAVSVNNILATSMAYFIVPTITMAMALTIFGERLNFLQWISIVFIFLAIALKIFLAGKLPWLSIVIALSWSLYTMMQKKIAIATLDRLTLETTLALPFLALFFFYWSSQANYQMVFNFEINTINLLLIGCGLVTITPLLFFNFGVKKTPFKWVSILQYLVPSINFLIAVFILDEELDYSTLVAFCMIWLGMIFFILAQLKENRRNSKIQSTTQN